MKMLYFLKLINQSVKVVIVPSNHEKFTVNMGIFNLLDIFFLIEIVLSITSVTGKFLY
jgi:hypothetical protein